MDGANLRASRWAPPSSRPHHHFQPNHLLPTPPPPSTNATNTFTTLHPSPSTSNTTSLPTPSQPKNLTTLQTTLTTLHTTHRHLRRLHHKSQLLLYSHHLALTQPTAHTLGSRHFASRRGETELMFRVDFFEWYVLLERCLVGLLGCVGVQVSSGFDPRRDATSSSIGGGRGRATAATATATATASNGYVGDGSGPGKAAAAAGASNSIIGDKHVFTTGYAHRFHQNVIDALDSEEGNLLHGLLGKGRVREYIGVCKEFRNRWKDVEREEEGSREGSMGGGVETGDEGIREEQERRFERRLRSYQDVLRDLQLDEMLGCVLEGLELAMLVAEEEVRRKGEELGLGTVLTNSNMVGGMEWERELEVDVAREGQGMWEVGADLMDLG